MDQQVIKCHRLGNFGGKKDVSGQRLVVFVALASTASFAVCAHTLLNEAVVL